MMKIWAALVLERSKKNQFLQMLFSRRLKESNKTVQLRSIRRLLSYMKELVIFSVDTLKGKFRKLFDVFQF